MTDFAEIWIYLSRGPLLWLTATLAAYAVGDALFRAAGLRVRRRYYLGLFPDWLRRPPRWLGWAERLLEGAPCLGASVVYHLEKPGGRRDAGLAGRRAGPGHRAGLLA